MKDHSHTNYVFLSIFILSRLQYIILIFPHMLRNKLVNEYMTQIEHKDIFLILFLLVV